MVETIKKKAGSIFNTQYNKPVYSVLVGAGVDFAYGFLAEFGVDVSTGLQTKTLILAMAITTWLVGNRKK